MKKIISVLALALALLCGLSACSMVQLNEERDGKTVVAEVGDTKILKSEFKLNLKRTLASYGMDLNDPTQDLTQYIDYYTTNTLDSLVNKEIMMQKADEMKLLPLSDEQEKEVTDSVSSAFDALYDAAMTSLKADEANSGKTDAELDKEANGYIDDYLDSMYFDRDSYTEYLREYYIMDLVEAEITKDEEVTEDQVRELYESKVESDTETFTATPISYEQSYLNGYTYYYVPAGAKIVRQLLIPLDEEKYTAIIDARSEEDDETADALAEQYLAEIKATADEAAADLKGGMAFTDAVVKYTGVSAEEANDQTLAIAPEGTLYDPTMRDAALALKEVGEITEPVATDAGYIILYLEEIPGSGAVPLSEVYDSLHDSLLTERRAQKLTEVLMGWNDEMGVKKYNDRLAVDLTK